MQSWNRIILKVVVYDQSYFLDIRRRRRDGIRSNNDNDKETQRKQ